MQPDMPRSSDERFAVLVMALGADPDVTGPADLTRRRQFGASAQLRVGNKIFAMLVGGQLVVKLPQQRVDALIAEAAARRFDPGHGRLMHEWASVAPDAPIDWLELATEAMRFVSAQR